MGNRHFGADRARQAPHGSRRHSDAEVIVSGQEVKSGKPSPEGYLLGASRLGVDPKRCLVFEDAVAGILAGEAAGADVTVITETHATPFETPHFSIANYQAWQPIQTAEGRLKLAAI